MQTTHNAHDDAYKRHPNGDDLDVILFIILIVFLIAKC